MNSTMITAISSPSSFLLFITLTGYQGMKSPVSEVVKIVQDKETIVAMVLSAVKEISVRDSPILYLNPTQLRRG